MIALGHGQQAAAGEQLVPMFGSMGTTERDHTHHQSHPYARQTAVYARQTAVSKLVHSM